MNPRDAILDLKKRISKDIVGQEHIVERICSSVSWPTVTCWSRGFPGLAKTRAVKSLAKHLDAGLSRVQFTPDLLPSDVTGTEIYHSANGKSEFRFSPGGHLQQSDPGRRDQPGAGQGAGGLLEAMEERQVTVAGDNAQAPRSLPGHGDPEPDRAGRHLPAARSTDGSLPDARLDRLSRTRPPKARHHPPGASRGVRGKELQGVARRDPAAAGAADRAGCRVRRPRRDPPDPRVGGGGALHRRSDLRHPLPRAPW